MVWPLSPLNPPIRVWAGMRVWIVGASSGIGRATAARLHALGAKVVVSARNAGALRAFCEEHPGSEALPLDVEDAASVRQAAERLRAEGRVVDLVMVCAGYYRPAQVLEDGRYAFSLAQMLKHQSVNYLGALHVLDAVLPLLLAQGHGHLSLVSSVAGYRGLPKALAYGPTKAALINLAEVLYLELAPQGIGVSLINPGFVQTGLTAQNDFDMPALLTPEQAARHIIGGWERGRFEIHFPRRFTFWLKLGRHLHDAVYFQLVRWATGQRA